MTSEGRAAFYERVNILKTYEEYCYQICFYLLDCDKLAVRAAKQALYEIFKDGLVCLRENEDINKLVRQVAIRSALQLYKANKHIDVNERW
jgi:hypothetical protein